VLVREEVGDALLLEEARNEVVVGLPVLNAVLARIVGARELEAEVREAVLAEELLQDVGHRFLLEDAAVGGAGEEPEPGDDVRAVVRVIAHRPGLREAADEAVEKPGAASRIDGDGDVLPDDGVEVETLVATEHLRLEVEEGRDPLGPAERRDEQRVGAEGRLDLEPAVRLGEIACHVLLWTEETASDLLVLLEVPADRGALTDGLPVETDLRVGHLDLRVVQRPRLAGDPALAL